MRRPARTLLPVLLAIGGLLALAACTPLTEVTQVAAGDTMACAVRTDGTVACWGTGPLGDGASEGGVHPVEVTGIGDAVQVAVGDRHACARRSGGTVSCWGVGDQGQMGNGAFDDQLEPVAVTGIATATDIDAFGQTTCARLTDATVRCWGDNAFGKLGDGTTTDSAVPLTIPGISDAYSLAVQDAAVCVALSTLEVSCWGRNGFGELGTGTIGGSSTTPVLVSGITSAIEVDGGQHHACARLTDGTARCWGYNISGQLGDGTTINRGGPVAVSGLAGAASIDAGKLHTCATLADGSVRCWGSNAQGAVDATGTAANKLTPVTVVDADLVPLAQVTAVSAGTEFSCAAQSTAQLRCWGRNVDGELGRGSTSAAEAPSSPLVNALVTDQDDLATSGDASCAVVGGGVECWGYNLYGQLGDGTTTSSKDRVDVLGITTATDVELGGRHACAIVDGGAVRCWGANDDGQVGDGTTSASPVTTPVTVTGITTATALALGANHSCAVLADETVRCWGKGTVGQLGQGAYASSPTPVAVSGLTGVVDLGAGTSHTCAVDSDEAAWCWGINTDGRLGDGGTSPSNLPVEVAGLPKGALRIDAGFAHTCAVLGSEDVWCWGQGSSGQLGNNLFTGSTVPVAASGLTGATDVAVGRFHSCASVSDGTARCWGINISGQIGDGSGAGYPVSPTGLTDVARIAVGFDTSCALLDDGTARCWGENYQGPVGDHTSADRFTPVGVIKAR